jgi:protein gp37
MGENSKIEWTDHTFSPWVGCTKVSPACDHCYAEGWARRTGQAHLWQGERRRTTDANWRQPVKWNRAAAAEGVRRRVFCSSLADVFDNQADDEWRKELWSLIVETPELDWLLLTKRPQNAARMLPYGFNEAAYPNVWIGTTVENQEEADRRIPHLLALPARVRFLSCEPLLGPVDLTNIKPPGSAHGDAHGWSAIWKNNAIGRPWVDWVIAGGESGPKARPSHPDWFRSLRDQCSAAGVAFFMKQWGEWDEANFRDPTPPKRHLWPDGKLMVRVGKKEAGRLLDGVEHNGLPK